MLTQFIIDKLKKLNFTKITPIQKVLFENFEKNIHIVGISPTGTGKTHAYLLPILSKINWQQNITQAIIVVPTNELVFQVFQMLKNIENYNSKVKIFYRGMCKNKTLNSLTKTQPPLVISTLDKLIEYAIIINKLNIKKASFFVLDEADMLFDQQSLNSLDRLLNKWNPKCLLFSSTITSEMKPFIKKYFGNSLFLDVYKEHQLNINYHLLHSPIYQRLNDLKHFLKKLNPYISFIFVSKKQTQNQVYEFLKKENWKILNFSSDLSVKKRKNYILEIKKNKYQYVITSDLAARGLDLDIDWIIHYDLPTRNLEFFLHRSGRTGRMEKNGNVLVLYDTNDTKSLQKITQNYNLNWKRIVLNSHGFQEINREKIIKNYNKKKLKSKKLISKKISKKIIQQNKYSR
ncbi:MAG: DEAD/DEAH box helicase [Vigna little leaf phytoplasma]|nr:DEAD/DEAH box helicase [Vigna little leaf phytoplasma]